MLVTPYIAKAVDIRRRCKKTPGVLLSVNGTYRPLDIDTHAYRNDPLRLIQFRVAFTSTHLRIYASLIVSIPNHPTSDIYSIAWMDRFLNSRLSQSTIPFAATPGCVYMVLPIRASIARIRTTRTQTHTASGLRQETYQSPPNTKDEGKVVSGYCQPSDCGAVGTRGYIGPGIQDQGPDNPLWWLTRDSRDTGI